MEFRPFVIFSFIAIIAIFGCVQEQGTNGSANLSPTQPENVAGFATLESGEESGGTGTGEYTQPAPNGTGTGTGSGSELGSESGSGSGSGSGYGDEGSGSGSGYDYGSGSGSGSGDEEDSGSGTGTGSGPSPIPNDASIKCTLDSASEDRAGTWNKFEPGIGGSNPTPYDWKWICSIEFTKTKTINSIEIKHELATETWSTQNPQLYPIVAFKGDTKLNTAYAQTLGTYNAGKYDNFKLFGQIESETFTGAIATFTFSDGTSASTKIAPSDKKPQAACSDSDGADYFTKGTTTKGATTKTDYCINTETLNEYTCKDNQVKDATYKCPNGCDKDTGACKPDTTTPAINFCSYLNNNTSSPYREDEIFNYAAGDNEFSGKQIDIKIKKIENVDSQKPKATFELYEAGTKNLIATAAASHCDDLRNLFIGKDAKPILLNHYFIKGFGKDDKGKFVSLAWLQNDVCVESENGGYTQYGTVIGTTGMLFGTIYKSSQITDLSISGSFNNGSFIDSKEFPSTSPGTPTLVIDLASFQTPLQGETTVTLKVKGRYNGQEINSTYYCIGDAKKDDIGFILVRVLDGETKEPIAGASLSLGGPASSYYLGYYSTQEDGVGFLADRAKSPPAPYQVNASAAGYEKGWKSDVYIYSGGKTEVTIELKKSEVPANNQLSEPILNKNPENRVSIKAFFEFEGPFTKMFYNNQMKQILDTYPNEVSFSFTNYPLSIIHRYGTITALAGECAAAQGKFFEFADQLYGNDYSTFTRDVLLNIAYDAKLDSTAFAECLEEQTYYPEVLDDIKQGNALDITGTPTFILSNGQREIRIVGAQSYDEFKKAIEFLLNDTEPPVDDAVIKSDFIVKDIVIKDAGNGYVDIIRNPFTGDTGTYYVKNKIGGIKGTGKYDGQSMTIAILQLLSTNPAFGTPLQATFELYDKDGRIVSTKTASIGDNLRYLFKAEPESGKAHYYEGETISSVIGAGLYKGQKLGIKFATLEIKRAAAGSQYPFIYTGTFELYNESGKLLDTQTAGKSDDLGNLFKDPNGQNALGSSVNIDLIGLSWPNYTGYIEVTVKKPEAPTTQPKQVRIASSPEPMEWNPKVSTSGTGAKLGVIQELNEQFELGVNVKIDAAAPKKIYKEFPSFTSPDATWLSGGPSSISYGTITEMPFRDSAGNIWYKVQFKQKLSTRGEAILANAWVTQEMLLKLNADWTTTKIPKSYTSHFKLEARGTGYKQGDFLLAKAGGALTQDVYLYVMSTDSKGGVSAFTAYASESKVLSNTAAPKAINLQAVSKPAIFEKKKTALFEDLACYDFDGDGTLTLDECAEDIETYLQKNIRGCWTQIDDSSHDDTPAEENDFAINTEIWYAGQDCEKMDITIPFERAKEIKVRTYFDDGAGTVVPYYFPVTVVDLGAESLDTVPLPSLGWDGEGHITVVVADIWQPEGKFIGEIADIGFLDDDGWLGPGGRAGLFTGNGYNRTGTIDVAASSEDDSYKSQDLWVSAIGTPIHNKASTYQMATCVKKDTPPPTGEGTYLTGIPCTIFTFEDPATKEKVIATEEGVKLFMTQCQYALGGACGLPAYRSKLEDILNAPAPIGYNGDIATYQDMIDYMTYEALEKHADHVLGFTPEDTALTKDRTENGEAAENAFFAGGEEQSSAGGKLEAEFNYAKMDPSGFPKVDNAAQIHGIVARYEKALSDRVIRLTEIYSGLKTELAEIARQIDEKRTRLSELSARQTVPILPSEIDELKRLPAEIAELENRQRLVANNFAITKQSLAEHKTKLTKTQSGLISSELKWRSELAAATAKAEKSAGMLSSVRKGIVSIGRGLKRMAGLGVAVIILNDVRNSGASEAAWNFVNGMVPATVVLDNAGPDSMEVVKKLAEKRQQLHDNVVGPLQALGNAYNRAMGIDKASEYMSKLREDQRAVEEGDPNAAQSQKLVSEANGLAASLENQNQ